MKTLSTMMLCLCVAVTIQAQIAGNEWYNGSIQYSAENIGGGKILMNAMDEGEEHECVLVPVAGKTETYKVTDGTNDCVNEYYGMTAKHIKKDGWDVIGFYNGKNQLVALMENTKKFAMHYEQVTQDRWKQQVIGEYTSEDGSAHVTCGNNHITVNGMKIPYRVVSFNGRATGYIQIEDSGTEFDGVWEVVPTYDGIHVNDSSISEEIKNYLGLIAPEKKDIVKLYNGTVPIFDNFGVTKQLKSGFGKTVNYKHGAYLIIEHTEAMHVVDVNSGTRIKKENNQETNALETNLGAADELARQLRLRDMGGIIIVDFIDMKLPEDRQLLYERMCKNMQKDRAKHNILPLSKFGLMQITRQRVRPAMSVNVDETCPTCFGKGTIKSSILFTDTLENKIDTLVNKIGIHKFYLHVHPYVAAYINKGVFSLKRQWQMRYGLGVRVIPSQKLAFLQYEFYDSDMQFIDMQEEIETK